MPPFLTNRPGLQFLFTRWPEIHNLSVGRGHWYIASCQVLLNYIKRIKRRSQKCLSQSQVGWSSCFSDRPKNPTNLVEDVEIFHSVDNT